MPLPDGAWAVTAPAKLNLNLLVGPVREDGYHPLDSLVSRITLFDPLEFHPRDGAQVRLTVYGADCGPMADNLVVRAAEALTARCGPHGADVSLTKAIPPGRGLGGGSSDAAATLMGLNALWGLALSDGVLKEVSTEIGSDVPLFLGPPTLRMTGRGEQWESVSVHPFVAVLILPPLTCSTAGVYKAYDAYASPIGPQLDPRLLAGGPPSAWRDLLVNDLTAAAHAVCPALSEMHKQLGEAVDAPVHLTGSGSGMFVLCDHSEEADAVANALRRTGVDAEILITCQAA